MFINYKEIYCSRIILIVAWKRKKSAQQMGVALKNKAGEITGQQRTMGSKKHLQRGLSGPQPAVFIEKRRVRWPQERSLDLIVHESPMG